MDDRPRTIDHGWMLIVVSNEHRELLNSSNHLNDAPALDGINAVLFLQYYLAKKK